MPFVLGGPSTDVRPSIFVDEESTMATPVATNAGSKPQKPRAARSRVKTSSSMQEHASGRDAFSNVLGHYVTDIRRHPPISREEEHELALGAEKGDRRAAERLLTSNLRLVVKIARDYRHAQVPLQDLVQEGNLGLVMAVRKFDAHRGVKLSTYAAWWIRAYILKYILDNSRLVRWGTTQAQRKLFFSLRKQQQKLLAQGLEASAATIATLLSVPEHEVVEMDRRLAESELSLDAPTRVDDDGPRSLVDHLRSADQVLPDSLAEQQELLTRLHDALDRFRATLEGRDQDILRERILNESPDTLETIGARYGISRERARQLEDRLKKRLEVFLDEELVGRRRDQSDEASASSPAGGEYRAPQTREVVGIAPRRAVQSPVARALAAS
jgi:RNA polymerase sigma-32 factor